MVAVTSLGRARLLAPTLFGVTIGETSVQIFVNGVLDTAAPLPSDFRGMRLSSEPLFVRGHPDYLLACKLDYSLGAFEVFGRELSREEFEIMGQGFSGNAQALVEPGSVLLGCSDCSIDQVPATD